MKFVARVVARFKRSPRMEEDGPPQPESSTKTALLLILAARALLHDQIDQSARNGMVADALPQALYGNHRSELAEIRRQLVEEEQGYRACAQKLGAMFPELPPPEAEPPAPPPPQYFPRMGDLLGKRPPRSPRAHH